MIAVVLSDGGEPGDAGVLGKQMERLRRLAHWVAWANLQLIRPGFLLLAAMAALPHVDNLVESQSLAVLERLARVVGGGAHA